MVSMLNIVTMGVCIAVILIAVGVPLYLVRQKSSRIETGFMGAVGYGLLGYIWYYLFVIFITSYLGILFKIEAAPSEEVFGRVAAINSIMAVVSSALVALSLFWGIYLTNQKQISLYRSAAVGIGFSIGKVLIDPVYPYLLAIYHAIQINQGTYKGDVAVKYSLVHRNFSSLVLDTCDGLFMYIIYFALALIMGYFYVNKKGKRAWVTVFGIHVVIMAVNVALSFLFKGGSKIATMISVALFASAGGFVLYCWFRYGEAGLERLPGIRELMKDSSIEESADPEGPQTEAEEPSTEAEAGEDADE